MTESKFVVTSAQAVEAANLKATPVPKGWNDKIGDPVTIKRILCGTVGVKASTIENILLKAGDKGEGKSYSFSSGNDFYFFNPDSDSTDKVLEPKGKDKLWALMGSDISKVKVQNLAG